MPTDILLSDKAVKRYFHGFTAARKQYDTAQDTKAKARARLDLKRIGQQLVKSDASLDNLVDLLTNIPVRTAAQDEDLKAYQELRTRMQTLQAERKEMEALVTTLQGALLHERTDHNETRVKLNQAQQELRALHEHILAAAIAYRRTEKNLQRYITAVAKTNPDEAMALQETLMANEEHAARALQMEHEIARLREQLEEQGRLAAEIAERSDADIAEAKNDSRDVIAQLQKENRSMQARISALQSRHHAHLSAPDQMFTTPSSHTADNVSDTARYVIKSCLVSQQAVDVACEWLTSNFAENARFSKYLRALAENADTTIASKFVTTSVRRAKLCIQADQACHHLWYVQQLILNACGAIDVLSKRVCNADTKDCENDVAIEPLIATLLQSFEASDDLSSFLADTSSELGDVGVSDALFVSEAAILGQTSSSLTEFLQSHRTFCSQALQYFADKQSESHQFTLRHKLGPAVQRAIALWATAIARLEHLGHHISASGLSVQQDLVDASRELLAQQDRQMEAVHESARQCVLFLEALQTTNPVSLASVTSGLNRPWFRTTDTAPDQQQANPSDELQVLVARMLQELAQTRPQWVRSDMGPGVQLLFASTVLDTLPPSSALRLYSSLVRFSDADLLAAAETVEDIANVFRAHFRGMHFQTQWDNDRYVRLVTESATPSTQLWQTTAIKVRAELLNPAATRTPILVDPLARQYLQLRGAEGASQYRQDSGIATDKHEAVLALFFQPSLKFPQYNAQQMPDDTQDSVDQRLMIHLRGAVMQQWENQQALFARVKEVISKQQPSNADNVLIEYINIWLTSILVKDTMQQDMRQRISTLQHMLAKNTLVYERQMRQVSQSMSVLQRTASEYRSRVAFVAQRLRDANQQLVTLRAEHKRARDMLRQRAQQYETLQAHAGRTTAAITSLEQIPASHDAAVLKEAMKGIRETEDNFIKFNRSNLEQLQKRHDEATTPEQKEVLSRQIVQVQELIKELEEEDAKSNGRDFEVEQVARQALATSKHLRSMLSQANKELAQIETEKHNLVNTEQVARAKVQTQSAKIQQLEKDLKTARESLESQRKLVNEEINRKVEATLANLVPADTEKLKALETKLAAYNQRVQEQRDEYINKEEQLKAVVDELRAHIDRLVREREAVDAQNLKGIQEYNTLIRTMERDYQTAQEALGDHTNTLRDQQTTLEQLRQELQANEARIAELTAQNNLLIDPAVLTTAEDQLQTMQVQAAETQDAIAALQAKNVELNRKIDAAQREFTTNTVKTVAQIATLRQEVQQAKDAQEAAKKAQAEMEASVTKYTQLIQALETADTDTKVDAIIAEHQLPATANRDQLLDLLKDKAAQKKQLLQAGVATTAAFNTQLQNAQQKLQQAEAERVAERAQATTSIKQLLQDKADSEQQAAEHMNAVRVAITEYDKQGQRASELLKQAQAIVMRVRDETMARFSSGQGPVDRNADHEQLQKIVTEYTTVSEGMAVQHMEVYNAALKQNTAELRLACAAFKSLTDPTSTLRIDYDGKTNLTSDQFINTVIDLLSTPVGAATNKEWSIDKHDWDHGPQMIFQRKMFEPAMQLLTSSPTGNKEKIEQLGHARTRMWTAFEQMVGLQLAFVEHKANIALVVKDMYLDMFNVLNDLDMSNLQLIQRAKIEISKILHSMNVGSMSELETMLKELQEELQAALNTLSETHNDYNQMMQIAKALGVIKTDFQPLAIQDVKTWLKTAFVSTFTSAASNKQLRHEDLMTLTEHEDPLSTENVTAAQTIAEQSSDEVRTVYSTYLRTLQLQRVLKVLAELQAYHDEPVNAIANIVKAQMQQSSATAATTLTTQVTTSTAELEELRAQQAADKALVEQLKEQLANQSSEQTKTKADLEAKIRHYQEEIGKRVKEATQKTAARKDAQYALKITQLQDDHRRFSDQAHRAMSQAAKLATEYQTTAVEQKDALAKEFAARLAEQQQMHQKALEAAKAENAAEKARFEEVLESLSTRIANADLAKQQVASDNSALINRRNELSGAYADLRAMIPHTRAELQDELKTTEEEVAVREKELEAAQKVVNDYKNRNAVMRGFITIAEWGSPAHNIPYTDAFNNAQRLEEELEQWRSKRDRLQTILEKVGKHLDQTPATATATATAAAKQTYDNKVKQLQQELAQATSQTVQSKVSQLEEFRDKVQREMDKQIATMAATLDTTDMLRFHAELQAHADSAYKVEASKALAEISKTYEDHAQQVTATAATSQPTPVPDVDAAALQQKVQQLEVQLQQKTTELAQHQQQKPVFSDNQKEFAELVEQKNAAATQVKQLEAQLQALNQKHAAEITEIKRIGDQALAEADAKCKRDLGLVEEDDRAYFAKHLGTTDFNGIVGGGKTIMWLLKQALLFKDSPFYLDKKAVALNADRLKAWVRLYRKAVDPSKAIAGETCEQQETVEKCLVHGNTCVWDQTCKPYTQVPEVKTILAANPKIAEEFTTEKDALQ